MDFSFDLVINSFILCFVYVKSYKNENYIMHEKDD